MAIGFVTTAEARFAAMSATARLIERIVAAPFAGVGSPARAGWFSGMGMTGNAWSNTPTLSLASEISATGKPVPTVEATPRIRSRSA